MKKLSLLTLILILIVSLNSCELLHSTLNLGEHTYEYIQYEAGHFKQYTCGCPSPDIIEEHYDYDENSACDACGYAMKIGGAFEFEYIATEEGHCEHKVGTTCDGTCVKSPHENCDADLFCDVCGYNMFSLIPPTNHFLRNQAGCEWLNKITAEDIAEIKIINEYVGVAPGTPKNIQSSTDEAVIARIFEDYYWIDTTPIPEQNGQISGGSAVTVKFILKDGTERKLYINNGNYLDSNGNYYELLYTPDFNDTDILTLAYGFISYTDKCEVWYEDGRTEPYFVCEIPIDELEFTYFDELLGPGVFEYPYFIKTEFGTLGFYSNDIFFIVGKGQYYQLVGKNLDELISDATVPQYSLTMNDEEWLYEDLQSTYKAGETVSLKIGIAYDLGYLLFVNGERIMPELHIDAPYWEFIFTMPESDVVIDFKTYDGFLPDMNYAVLIETFWEKIPEAESVSIIHYYGEYEKGAIVAMMACSEYDYTEALWDEKVGDTVIHYNNGNRILVLYEGEFYNLTQAYNNGYISAEDLADIAELHAEFYPFLY